MLRTIESVLLLMRAALLPADVFVDSQCSE